MSFFVAVELYGDVKKETWDWPVTCKKKKFLVVHFPTKEFADHLYFCVSRAVERLLSSSL
jgi:hypothetical protein